MKKVDIIRPKILSPKPRVDVNPLSPMEPEDPPPPPMPIGNGSVVHFVDGPDPEYPPSNYVLNDDIRHNNYDEEEQADNFDVERLPSCRRKRRTSFLSKARKSLSQAEILSHIDIERLTGKRKLFILSFMTFGASLLDFVIPHVCTYVLTPIRPSAMRSVADEFKSLHNVFAALNISLALFGTAQVILCAKDMENSHLKYRNVNAAKKEFFDLGSYPMSGMFMILFGGVLDGLTTMAFLCGFCCECSYYRHFMRFSFMNLLLTVTCAVVLYVTEVKADEHMKRYFKIIMHIEYGTAHHPVAIYNFIDRVQIYGQCCGYKGPEDWKESRWWETARAREVLPNSCCPNSDDVRLCYFSTPDRFLTGCKDMVFDTVGGYRKAAKYVVLVKAPVVFTAIVLCSLLYKRTWEFKANRRHSDNILNRDGALGRLFAQGQLQMLGMQNREIEAADQQREAREVREVMEEEREALFHDRRVTDRLMSHGWDSSADFL